VENVHWTGLRGAGTHRQKGHKLCGVLTALKEFAEAPSRCSAWGGRRLFRTPVASQGATRLGGGVGGGLLLKVGSRALPVSNGPGFLIPRIVSRPLTKNYLETFGTFTRVCVLRSRELFRAFIGPPQLRGDLLCRLALESSDKGVVLDRPLRQESG